MSGSCYNSPSSRAKPTQVKVEGGFKKSHDASGESNSDSDWTSGSPLRDSQFSPVESNRLQICSRLPGTEVYVKDSQHFVSIKREKSEFSHCKTPNFLVSESPSTGAKSSCPHTHTPKNKSPPSLFYVDSWAWCLSWKVDIRSDTVGENWLSRSQRD